MSEHETPADSGTPEPTTVDPAPAADATTDDDDADDFEDLEFLLDDIEDQIAPLGL